MPSGKSEGRSTPAKSTSLTGPKKRLVRQSNYRSFRLHKRIKKENYKLASIFKISRSVWRVMVAHPLLYSGIFLIYLALTIVLVNSNILNISSVADLKDTFADELPGFSDQLAFASGLLVYLAGSSTVDGGSAASVYQPLLMITTGLALIWALRQSFSQKSKKLKIRIRDAYYKGMAQVIPFFMIVLLLLVELLPLAIGGFLLSTVIQNGIAVELIEKAVWLLLFIMSGLLSLYLILSTMFSLFVAALPDMTPMQALRSGRELVRHRRLVVLLKLIGFGLLMVIAIALLLIPVIIFAPRFAEISFFILSSAAFMALISFNYGLYRELLK